MKLIHIKIRPVPSQEELGVAEEALERVRRDLADRKRDERQLQETSLTQQSSWMSKITANVMGTSGAYHSFFSSPLKSKRSLSFYLELTAIQREIDGLLALEYQMERKLDNMKQVYSNARHAKTLHGYSLLWFGRMFAVYCVFRTLSVRKF